MDNNTGIHAEDDYGDIEIPNFNNERELQKELDEIIEITKDNSADWKKRETAVKRLGGVMLSNMSNYSSFIKQFNQKLCLNLSVQLVDLRSSLMKEACRVAILAAKIYHEGIESAIEKMVSPLVLYKLVGCANKLISDTGANCILEIIKNVETPKIIYRIHEQLKNKSITVRLRCCQELLWIVTHYSKNTISKHINLIEEFIQTMTHDASMEVRACARKIFMKFSDIFPTNGNKLMNTFDYNVIKTINDENSILNKTEDDGNVMFNNLPKAKSLSGSHHVPILVQSKDNHNINMITTTMSTTPNNNKNNSLKNDNNKFNINKQNQHLSPKKTIATFNNNATPNNKQLAKTETKNIMGKASNKNPVNDKSQSASKNIVIKKDYFSNKNNYENIDKAERDESPENVKLNQNNSNNNAQFPLPNELKPKFKNIEDLVKSKINSILILSQIDIIKKVTYFEQISSLFNEIYSNIDYISKNTLKNLIDVHITNLTETNSKLAIQVMKNLTKFIFYLDDIFTEENIFKITKIVIINISSDNEQIAMNSGALFEIMRKKIDPNLIIKPIIEVMEADTESIILEICFDVINPLIDMAVLALSDQTYLNNFIKKMADILLTSNSQNSSSTDLKYKILDCFELIYRKYPKQFLLSFKDLNLKENKNLMILFEVNKKVIHEYINKNINNLNSGPNSREYLNLNVRSNSANKFNDNSGHQNSQYNSQSNTQSNSTKNHQFVDSYDVSDVNFEILAKAASIDSSVFISYLKTDQSLNLENFLLALVRIKYEQVSPILQHIRNILNSDKNKNLFFENMPLLINRLVFLIEKFPSDYSEIVKEILIEIPIKLDKEIYLQIIPKYITSRQSPHIVQTLLLSIKNVLTHFYHNSESLLLLLPSFIETVFNTLNHHISDVRKLAVYCIVDIHFILGKDFDAYLSELNPSQRNLINIYIKKKQESFNNGYK